MAELWTHTHALLLNSLKMVLVQAKMDVNSYFIRFPIRWKYKLCTSILVDEFTFVSISGQRRRWFDGDAVPD